MSTLVTSFRCKIYILYFIMSMLTLCQGRYIYYLYVYTVYVFMDPCVGYVNVFIWDTKLSCNEKLQMKYLKKSLFNYIRKRFSI